jgi:hypothetical protein
MFKLADIAICVNLPEELFARGSSRYGKNN